MNLFYNLGISLYSAAVGIAATRNNKARLMKAGQAQTFGILAEKVFSPSGYEVRKDYPLADVVCYLPMDKPSLVRRFLDAVKIEKAFFVKYEFWGNYLSELKRRGIPTYIISAIFRPTQAFFKWYGATFRRMLGCYDMLFVQDEESRALLAGIGVDNVVVAGDTRFDRVTDILGPHRPAGRGIVLPRCVHAVCRKFVAA